MFEGKEILQIFKTANLPIQIPANFRHCIEKENAVWFLEKGSVNLFAIELKDHVPEGPRSLIANIAAPALLFDIAPPTNGVKYKIFAVSEMDGILWELPTNVLSKALSEKVELAQEFCYLLPKWL